MRLLVIMAAALAAGIAHGAEPAGVYGYVQKVVLESANGQPQRMQIWGTFCVAAPAPSDAYQEPESGYLYVEMPAEPRGHSPGVQRSAENLRQDWSGGLLRERNVQARP